MRFARILMSSEFSLLAWACVEISGGGSVSAMDYQQYEKLEVIGEGCSGVVYRGRDRKTGKLVAIKKVRKEDTSRDFGMMPFVLREISILQDLHHENIVRLQDVIYQDRKLYLVFEHLDEDLRMYLAARSFGLSRFEIKSFTRQILLGVSYCHMNNVIHRDLKPDNILINKSTMTVKVADFSLSRHFRGDDQCLHVFTNKVVTLWYRAPELLLGAKAYSTSIDLWAVGCILAEMGLGTPLFNEKSEAKQLLRIYHILGTPDETTWSGVTCLPKYKPFDSVWPPRMLSTEIPDLDLQGIDLLQKLLTLDPKRRITAQAALEHEYFAELRDLDAGRNRRKDHDGAGTSRRARVNQK